MDTLEQAYNIIQEKHKDLIIEPLQIVRAVEEHKKYWKPKHIKTLLLSQSHSFTTTSEYNNTLNYGRLAKLAMPPASYVKHVYCLGYGEPKLHTKRNYDHGTYHFWNIFANCVKKNPTMMTKSNYHAFTPRILEKINILHSLKTKGIWLTEASIVPLYDRGVNPNRNIIRSVTQMSWEHHVSKTIQKENPEKIIIVGLGVFRTLEDEIQSLGIPFVVQKQPQSHMASDELKNTFRKYYELCN